MTIENTNVVPIIATELPNIDIAGKGKRDGSHSKDNQVSQIDVSVVCSESDCNIQYSAKQTTYKNGDIVVSPPRCPACQSAYLINLRTNKVLQGIKGIAQIKMRIQPLQRKAILDTIANEYKVLTDVFAGTAISKGSFDIRRI